MADSKYISIGGRGQSPHPPTTPVVTPQGVDKPSDQSGQVPMSDYLRLVGATALRSGLPIIGQALGGEVTPFASLLGGAGGGLGEALAEQLEPGHDLGTLVKPSVGRLATAAGLGAVPGSWIMKAGRPLASAVRGGALSYAGIAGNKIADGTPVADAINPASKSWNANEYLNLGVGAGIGGALGSIGGPKSPPPPPKPTIDPIISELGTPSGLRVAAKKLSQLPTGAPVTLGVKMAHAAVADTLERSPTGALAQEIIGPKGVPPKPSINEMDNLHQEGIDLTNKMTPEQRRAYAESKTDQQMLLKAQKYAEKVQADKLKAQTASGAEQARALDKSAKVDAAAQKMRGAAEDQNLKVDAQREKVQGQALEDNKKFDAQTDKDQLQAGTAESRGIDAANKRALADQKASEVAAQQAIIDARKTAEGVVPTTTPVVETVKGVGPNGEAASSRTIYDTPQTDEPSGGVDESGNPVTPLAPHEQAYFSKGDALKAAKAANKAAAEQGSSIPYDPREWNIQESPSGGARIVKKAGSTQASPALTEALAAEEAPKPSPDGATPPVDQPATTPVQAAPQPAASTEPAPTSPISLEQFNKINSEPQTSVTPVEPPVPQVDTPAPADTPTEGAPPAPPVARGIGAEGQPIIPFRTPLEAAGANYTQVKDALASGEKVPEAGRAVAGQAAGRIRSESPIASDWGAMTDRQQKNFLTNIKRGLNAGTNVKAPALDPSRPGAYNEPLPELPTEPVEDPSSDKGDGTTLSAFGAGQGSNVMTAIRNNPMLAARLGLGTAGAVVGAANNQDDPLKGALVGGTVGAALPSALALGGRAIGNIDWADLAKRAPDIMKFGYLAPVNSQFSNTVVAPVGLSATSGIEKYLENAKIPGLFEGNPEERQKALNVIKGIPGLAKRWWPKMAEAGQMLAESPDNVGEMKMTSGKPTTMKGWFNSIIAGPAQSTVAGHLAARDNMIDAGYTKPQATEMTLGNDPNTGSGNRSIRRFGSGLQNMKSTTLPDDPPGAKNILAQLAAPFTRTATNVAAATPTRFPGLGIVLKAANLTEESWPAIVAQQGLSTALSGVAYEAGRNTDPANAPMVRKWVRNIGGRYGMTTTIFFEMGQAAQRNKSLATAAGKGIISGVPMPTTEPAQDIWNSLVAGSDGNLQLPGSFVPGPIKDAIPPEYLTKRSR